MKPTAEQLADPKWWDENAPDGASCIDACCYEFYRSASNDRGGEYFDPDAGKWFALCDHYSSITIGKHISFRPAAKHWRGPQDGLPPVGAVCEYLDALNRWKEVRITGHAELGICFRSKNGSGENYVAITAQFRPIRTPEQIADEEREEGISAMYEIAGKYINSYPVCQCLYDAGYRKQ